MSRLLLARIAVGVAGLLVFGYGVRAEADEVRWAGIALLAIAAAMRLIKPARDGRG